MSGGQGIAVVILLEEATSVIVVLSLLEGLIEDILVIFTCRGSKCNVTLGLCE